MKHHSIVLTTLLTFLIFVVPVLYAATITVDSANDFALPSIDGNCTLREAVEAAHTNAAVDSCAAGSGADKIVFDAAMIPASIQLTSQIYVSATLDDLAIEGPGADKLDVKGGVGYRIFHLDSSGNDAIFSLSGMSLKNGSKTGTTGSGGAIYLSLSETLNLADVKFESNTAQNGGGAIMVSNASDNSDKTTILISRCYFEDNQQNGATTGGAIRVGTNTHLTIEDSTFVNNQSNHINAGGGAIAVFSNAGAILGATSTVDIIRSTFSANSSYSSGGAISFSGGGITATIQHSTIVNNTSDSDADDSGSGGGIKLSGSAGLGGSPTLHLVNTIVANNQDNSPTGDVFDDISFTSGILNTNGFNFIGSNASVTTEFPSGAPNGNIDYVGIPTAKLDPMLDVLGDYGGPTQTYQPTAGSTAVVDRGSCSSETQDQRGFGNDVTKKRIVDDILVANGSGSDGCDIGAVESNAEEITPEDPICFPIKSSNGKVAIICL